MILAGPGVPKGINNTPVSLVDVAATARGIAGLKIPSKSANWQSSNLLDTATNPDDSRFVISEYHDGGCPTGMFMLRKGAWKYIYYAGNYPPQLFNLEQDPDELTNLADEPLHAATVQQLHGHLLGVLDPDEVNKEAFADQALLAESFGGARRNTLDAELQSHADRIIIEFYMAD